MAEMNPTNPRHFTRLMRLGHVARAEGYTQQAHQYWRHAALLQPDNEQVWQALYQIVDSNDDRRVCLRNILAINPDNIHARQMLDDYLDITEPNLPIEPDIQPLQRQTTDHVNTIPLWRHMLLRGVQIALLGFLLAVGITGIQVIL